MQEVELTVDFGASKSADFFNYKFAMQKLGNTFEVEKKNETTLHHHNRIKKNQALLHKGYIFENHMGTTQECFTSESVY